MVALSALAEADEEREAAVMAPEAAAVDLEVEIAELKGQLQAAAHLGAEKDARAELSLRRALGEQKQTLEARLTLTLTLALTLTLTLTRWRARGLFCEGAAPQAATRQGGGSRLPCDHAILGGCN